jgi:hypothetical protein
MQLTSPTETTLITPLPHLIVEFTITASGTRHAKDASEDTTGQ